MIRTQVQLNEIQVEVLRARAASEKVSVAELVRQAVDQMIEGEGLPTTAERRRRAMAVVGRYASGATDVSTRHDHYLSEAYDA